MPRATHGRWTPGRSHQPASPPDRGRDAGNPAQARHLEQTRPGWVVMWSSWRRTYTAFAYFAPEAVVIDEAEADRLVIRLNEAEQHFATHAALRQRGTF